MRKRLAVEVVDEDPLLEASFYPGDLLVSLLRLPDAFLQRQWDLKRELLTIHDRAMADIDASDVSVPPETAAEIARCGEALSES